MAGQDATTATPLPPHLQALADGAALDALPNASDTAPAAGVDQPTVASCVVSKRDDRGAGTLRDCLTRATPGMVISFRAATFPVNANPLARIDLLTALPEITVNNLTIDGSNVRVLLHGGNLTEGNGLVVNGASGVKIWGLLIAFFPGNGILLYNGASATEIGGDRTQSSNPLGRGNVLAGNKSAGIRLIGPNTNGNQLLGNYVGVDTDGASFVRCFNGDATIPCHERGVVLERAAAQNRIGGGTPATSNLISGNKHSGIWLRDAGTSGNQIIGNLIGTTSTGMAALANGQDGITVSDGASDNTIGGTTPNARNVISGNTYQGIWLTDPGTERNVIEGNYIGTTLTGDGKLGNRIGVLISAGAKNNRVGGTTPQQRNLISGNREDGVGITDAGTTGNRIVGNYIGTDLSGTGRLGNTDDGILIANGASDNWIGEETPGAGNVISANAMGIHIVEQDTDRNRILGNLIGTDSSGTKPLGNQGQPGIGDGINIGYGASHTIIGGEMPGARNIISANGDDGITLQNGGTNGTQVIGNYIGTDITGRKALGNAEMGVRLMGGVQATIVGGVTPAARNIISGNDYMGIQLRDPGTSGNRIIGNFIGVDVTGATPLPNGDKGVWLWLGASDNFIGDVTPGAGNVISANGDDGIKVEGPNATGNKIWGNFIGTDLTGAIDLGNQNNGIILMEDASATVGGATTLGARGNFIGGTVPGARNLISGNGHAGIFFRDATTTGNVVQGNLIGVNLAGTEKLPNGVYGIFIGLQARANQIGGTSAAARNVISGNGQAGLWLQDRNTNANVIQGNYIGVAGDGATALGNGKAGIVLSNGPQGTKIGGSEAGAGNVISANGEVGVWISGTATLNNEVSGNWIGTGANGVTPAGNRGHGVYLFGGANGNTVGISNTIVFNDGMGVALLGEATLRNRITRTAIHNNRGGQLRWLTTIAPTNPNQGLQLLDYPAATGLLRGRACPGCRVEIFTNPAAAAAGARYIGTVNVDSAGAFTFVVTNPATHPYLAATQLYPDGTTSEFSAPITLSGEVATPTPITPTPITPTPVTPTPVTPTPMTPTPSTSGLYLPVVVR
jgi:hypothetical protein